MGTNSRNHVVGPQDLRNIADVLTSSGAHVIGLQEVHCELLAFAPPARQITSALNEPRLLAHGTGMHYAFGSTLDDPPAYAPNTGYMEWGTADQWSNNGQRHGEFGNAVLSRFAPMQPVENIPLPRQGNDEQRACLRVEFNPEETGGTTVVVYNTHLHHQGAETRASQLEAILQRAGVESTGTIVFIMGDLNWKSEPGTAEEAALCELLARFGFHDLAAHSSAPTFPADNPDRRIDYILCNQPLPVLSAEVLRTLSSDHLPLVVTVELGN